MTGRASSTRASPEAGPSTGSNAGPSRPTSPYNIDGGVHDETYGLEGFAATAASTEAITPFISSECEGATRALMILSVNKA